MSKYCPILKERVVYLQCMDCDEKKCQTISKNSITDNENIKERSDGKFPSDKL